MVELTDNSSLAADCEEVEEKLGGISTKLEHSPGNRNSREHFHLLL
jgi:hypothetical protein